MRHIKIRITKNKINLLYVVSSLSKQGPVQVLYDIVSNLDYSKYNVSLITLKEEGVNSLYEEFSKLPLKITQYKNISKFNIYAFYKNLKSYIYKNEIDIAHSHCFRSLLLIFFLRRKVITFHTIHIYPGLQTKTMNGKLLGAIVNIITKYAIKRINCPVACSKSLAQELIENDKIKVNYIRNGSRPHDIEIDKAKTKQNLNLDQEYGYFISIGRFSPEKNFKTLVSAFLAAELKNYKLIVLGDGPLYDEINKMANASVILPGFKKNVNEYIAASDFYISTSLTEGLPLSVLEAMSWGLPIVLSEIPSHKEIFELAKDEDIGELFDNNLQVSIIDSIHKIIDNPNYNSLKSNIRDVFNLHFDVEKMSKSYQKLYREALN